MENWLSSPRNWFKIAWCGVLLFGCLGVVTADVGQFWHVTDLHVDNTFFDTAVSCHDHLTFDQRGMFGNELCDAPWSLINSSVYAMKEIAPDVDFIIWTGDNVFHTAKRNKESDYVNTDIVLGILDNITSLLTDVFPHVTTYPALGNHDYFPDSQYPSHGNAIYRHMERSWSIWANGSDFTQTFTKGGYYTTLIRPGFRIVSLNNNLYYSRNRLTLNYTDLHDPAGQFRWLNDTLVTATSNQEKVLLISHILPGVNSYQGYTSLHPPFNEIFHKIISHHVTSGVIVAMHFGHDHRDEFKIYYDSEDVPRIPVFLAPSITPWRWRTDTGRLGPAHNPGIRLVSYDRDTGRHLDIKQYYLDLRAANRDRQAQWRLLYQSTQAYGIPDVTAQSLSKARELMLDTSQPYVQGYYNRVGVLAQEEICDDECRYITYCGMRYFDLSGFQKCTQDLKSGSRRPMTSAVLLTLVSVITLKLC